MESSITTAPNRPSEQQKGWAQSSPDVSACEPSPGADVGLTQRAQQPTRAAKMSCPHMLARVPAFAHLRSGSPACSARLRRMPLRVCHTTSQLAATCNPECPAQRIGRLCRALVVPPSSVVSMLAHYFDASRDESCARAKLKHRERMPRMKCDEHAHPHTEQWPPRKGSLARSQAPRLPFDRSAYL